jgi:Plasmid recombination enzyme
MTVPAAIGIVGTITLKKIKGASHLLAAAQHNKRTLYERGDDGKGKIDHARTHLNYSVDEARDPEAVQALWHQLRKSAGITEPKRKDEVSAIEAVFSLPYVAANGIDTRSYFEDCTTFACRNFGGNENLLSADVHLDQEHPHCHVLMLPLGGGKMCGSDLCGSGSNSYAKLQDRFFNEVAVLYGLSRPAAKALPAAQKIAAAEMVRDHLDTLTPERRWELVRQVIHGFIKRDPVPFVKALGLSILPHRKTQRTFKQIALSPGKGPKTRAGAEARDRQIAWAIPGGDGAGLAPKPTRLSSTQAAIGPSNPIRFPVLGVLDEHDEQVASPDRTLCSDRVRSPDDRQTHTSAPVMLPSWLSLRPPGKHRRPPVPSAVAALFRPQDGSS